MRNGTYPTSELKKESDGIARGLLASGLQKGDRIIHTAPADSRGLYSISGCFEGGLRPCCQDRKCFSPQNISYRILHAQAQAVIFDSSLRGGRVEWRGGVSPASGTDGFMEKTWGDWNAFQQLGVETPT